MGYHPYLMFNGDCREAFTRYQEVLGGDLQIVTAGDMPEGERPGDVDPKLVMNAALIDAGGSILYGSDDPTVDAAYGPVERFSVNRSISDVAEVERIHAALAEGGTVTMPLSPTSWSPMFGMCVDRFGIPWMVMAEAPDAG